MYNVGDVVIRKDANKRMVVVAVKDMEKIRENKVIMEVIAQVMGQPVPADGQLYGCLYADPMDSLLIPDDAPLAFWDHELEAAAE